MSTLIRLFATNSEASGFKWTAPKLLPFAQQRLYRDWVRTAGRLCTRYPLINQHRASGDADATAILFFRLLEWDVEGVIEKMIKDGTRPALTPTAC
jgi:DNA polymerase-3 subunit epsilon